MKQIKEEFKNKVVFNGKIGKDVHTANIKPEQYDFYIKNGLSFIFEDVCPKCNNGSCTCKSVGYFDKAESEAKDYISNKKKK